MLGTRMACTGSEALVKRRCACRGVPPGEGRGLLQHKSPGQRARGAAPEAPRPIGFGASTCSTARRYRPETRRPADPGADRGVPGGFHGVRTGRPIRDQPERSARSSPATASRLSTRACRLPRLTRQSASMRTDGRWLGSGEHLGVTARTVQRRLQERDVTMRASQERAR